jgi:HlyD family secretion protein
MTRKKKIFIGAGIVVVLGAVAYANFKFKRTEGVTVNTEKVQKRNLQAIVSASGKIQAKRTVNISADTSGRVTELAVNEGDRVKEGQFLLQIDPRNLRTRVQSGEASLGAAQSSAEQLRLALESSRTALKLAQDNYKRQQELWKGGLTTREQYERAESELRGKEQDLRAQEQNVKTQQLRMNQEQATLENAKTDLSKVRIESPINGIVTRRNIEAGETAVVGTMNNAGTVLLTIADMSVIEAEVEVDETDIPTVRIGQPAKITIDAMTGKSFTGRVTEIGNSPIQGTGGAQQQSQATNFKVVITVEGEIPDVRPGFTCTAEITTATRDSVVAVPIQATTVREVVVDDKGTIVREPEPSSGAPRRPGGVQASELKPGQERKEIEGVFLVRDNKAVFEPVKTGIAGEKYFEVISGLKDGDSVIVGPFSSVRQLADGALVKIEEAPRGPTTTTTSSR